MIVVSIVDSTFSTFVYFQHKFLCIVPAKEKLCESPRPSGSTTLYGFECLLDEHLEASV